VAAFYGNSLHQHASALAKRYLREGRSTMRMKEITGRPKRWGGLFVSSFVEIEVVSAIAKEAREFGAALELRAGL